MTRALGWYFIELGTVGFGGPVALVARMRRELVEERQWITEQEFNDGLALAQLAPGPLAAQLAMYLGWVRGGIRGATLAGLGFVAPSLVTVVALAAVYQRTGGLPWIAAMFYGVGAAVIAIIGRSSLRLARASLHGDAVLWLIACVNAIVTVAEKSESVLLVAASGALLMLLRGGPLRLRIGAARGVAVLPSLFVAGGTATVVPILATLFVYFATAGLVVFGSGLAIVPYLHGGVVEQRHWLTERQFLDAIAISLLTPGPVVVIVAFIGFLVAGLGGAAAAAAGVFLPTYGVVLLLAPHFGRLLRGGRVRSFSTGVTAAAVGALMGASLVLASRALTDAPTVLIASVVLIVLARWPRVPEPAILVAASLTGLLLRGV